MAKDKSAFGEVRGMKATAEKPATQETLDATLRQAREEIGKMYEEMGDDAFFAYVLNDMDEDL